jgi:hypothetical protein
MTSKTTNKFSPEVRARAVWLVLDHASEHASRRAAVTSIEAKIGCTPQALHDWVKNAERCFTLMHRSEARPYSVMTTSIFWLLQRPVESTQHISIKYIERLAEAGAEPSVGSVGDSYDNAHRNHKRSLQG